MGRWKNNPTPAEIDKALEQQMEALDRTPLRKLIAHLVQAEPDMQSMMLWARKNPDKWSQAINNISRAAGLIQKEMPEINVNLNINQMSDAQIMQEIQQRQRVINEQGLLPQTEGQYIDMPTTEGKKDPEPTRSSDGN